jgi:hypothetical protein
LTKCNVLLGLTRVKSKKHRDPPHGVPESGAPANASLAAPMRPSRRFRKSASRPRSFLARSWEAPPPDRRLGIPPSSLPPPLPSSSRRRFAGGGLRRAAKVAAPKADRRASPAAPRAELRSSFLGGPSASYPRATNPKKPERRIRSMGRGFLLGFGLRGGWLSSALAFPYCPPLRCPALQEGGPMRATLSFGLHCVFAFPCFPVGLRVSVWLSTGGRGGVAVLGGRPPLLSPPRPPSPARAPTLPPRLSFAVPVRPRPLPPIPSGSPPVRLPPLSGEGVRGARPSGSFSRPRVPEPAARPFSALVP